MTPARLDYHRPATVETAEKRNKVKLMGIDIATIRSQSSTRSATFTAQPSLRAPCGQQQSASSLVSWIHCSGAAIAFWRATLACRPGRSACLQRPRPSKSCRCREKPPRFRNHATSPHGDSIAA